MLPVSELKNILIILCREDFTVTYDTHKGKYQDLVLEVGLTIPKNREREVRSVKEMNGINLRRFLSKGRGEALP